MHRPDSAEEAAALVAAGVTAEDDRHDSPPKRAIRAGTDARGTEAHQPAPCRKFTPLQYTV